MILPLDGASDRRCVKCLLLEFGLWPLLHPKLEGHMSPGCRMPPDCRAPPGCWVLHGCGVPPGCGSPPGCGAPPDCGVPPGCRLAADDPHRREPDSRAMSMAPYAATTWPSCSSRLKSSSVGAPCIPLSGAPWIRRVREQKENEKVVGTHLQCLRATRDCCDNRE